MSRFTRMAWWVLPVAVALTGSVAVGATVEQTASRASSSLPEVTVPPVDPASSSPTGSKGVVLPGRALVPGSAPAVAPVTTTAPSGEDPAATPSPSEQGSNGEGADEPETPLPEVPPPTVVPVKPGEDDEEQEGNHRDRSTTTSTTTTNRRSSQGAGEDD